MKILKILFNLLLVVLIGLSGWRLYKATSLQEQIDYLNQKFIFKDSVLYYNQKKTERSIKRLELLREDYIVAYPEDRYEIAGQILREAIEAPIIELPDDLRDFVINMPLEKSKVIPYEPVIPPRKPIDRNVKPL
jgi:hypothetical protein